MRFMWSESYARKKTEEGENTFVMLTSWQPDVMTQNERGREDDSMQSLQSFSSHRLFKELL